MAHSLVVLQKIVGKHNGHEGMLHIQLRKLRKKAGDEHHLIHDISFAHFNGYFTHPFLKMENI
jgi:hypothetical protein